MRISEEQDRRQREALIQDRLPRAVTDVQGAVTACVESYTAAFGAETAAIEVEGPVTRIIVRDQQPGGEWTDRAKVEIVVDETVPGFRIERVNAAPLVIEVGLLPGDKLFYRDKAEDQYVSLDEVTHRSLDRAFFPKLRE